MITAVNTNTPAFGLSMILKGRTPVFRPIKREEKLPEVIAATMEKIEKSKNGREASEVLVQAAKDGDFKMYNGVRFKNGEYQIQNLFTNRGIKYEKDLKTLNSLNLDIVPKHIKTVTKDKDMFILTKIPGCKSGDLIPYSQAKHSVPKDNKLSAFRDLKKLTKAGYTDDKILYSPSAWFVTPDDKRVVLPSFEAFRKLQPGENKDAISAYHKILFG